MGAKPYLSATILVLVLWTGLRANHTTVKNVDEDAKVKQPTQFGCTTTERGINDWHVNCSFHYLVFIPALPKFATSVDLSNNQLAMLFDPTSFFGMTELRELDLSDNPLQYIPTSIFRGLTQLTKLYIKNSLLYKQQNLILDSLLFGLSLLRHFSFTFKLPENRRLSPIPCTVRHKAQPFGKVDSLQEVERLEIDSALLKWSNNASKSIAFRTQSLDLINGFFCFYGNFNQDQFEYMPLLENISIQNPFLTGEVSNNFVHSNPLLTELAIYGPNAPYGQATTLIYNVTESVSNLNNLTSLILEDISDNIRLKFHCSELGIYNLTGLHYLTNLSLAGNSLSFNVAEDCSSFPTSLKHIDLRRNCISLSEINYSVLFSNKQVETIDASDQSNCAFMIKKQRLRYFQHIQLQSSSSLSIDNKYSLQRLVFTNSTEALNFGDANDHYLHLKYLDLSLNNKALITTVPYFFSSSRPVLEYLDMSNCRVSNLENYSFSNFSKLEYLDLSLNSLGKMQCSLSDRLLNLKSLKTLNIANNNIKCITSFNFDRMKSIQSINISKNEIQSFDASLAQTGNLEYLDLSGNRLEKLSEDTMKHLDKLAFKKTIKVDLSGNTLLCTCHTLKFLRWMKTTKTDLLKRDEYLCTHGNGSITNLKHLPDIVNRLTSQCSPKTAIIVSVSAFVTCCLASFCGILVYRFRWRIRYWYYKTKLKIPYKPMGRGYEQMFEYDIFISYSSEDYSIARQGTLDELETVRGFRACIHERDFKPGESIALNISRGIRSSRRTVLFVSKGFLASEWCMYELNIARMEALHTGRKVILVVMLESIPSGSMPVDVLDIIDAYTYLEYPKHGTEVDLEVFWSKCADFISDN